MLSSGSASVKCWRERRDWRLARSFSVLPQVPPSSPPAPPRLKSTMDVDPPAPIPIAVTTAAAPLKLTFRLGASSATAGPSITPSSGSFPMDATPSASSVASEQSNAPPIPLSAEDRSFGIGTGGGIPAKGVAAEAQGVAAEAQGEEAPEKPAKPKRKRAPKRPAGEPGPGKHWRKGLKGYVVALSSSLVARGVG